MLCGNSCRLSESISSMNRKQNCQLVIRIEGTQSGMWDTLIYALVADDIVAVEEK